jgi:hypothetical protein
MVAVATTQEGKGLSDVKESKTQRAERLKRELNPWEAYETIERFARDGQGSIPPEWGTYFRWWGIYSAWPSGSPGSGSCIGALGRLEAWVGCDRTGWLRPALTLTRRSSCAAGSRSA